jgi:hypothetical protein
MNTRKAALDPQRANSTNEVTVSMVRRFQMTAKRKQDLRERARQRQVRHRKKLVLQSKKLVLQTELKVLARDVPLGKAYIPADTTNRFHRILYDVLTFFDSLDHQIVHCNYGAPLALMGFDESFLFLSLSPSDLTIGLHASGCWGGNIEVEATKFGSSGRVLLARLAPDGSPFLVFTLNGISVDATKFDATTTIDRIAAGYCQTYLRVLMRNGERLSRKRALCGNSFRHAFAFVRDVPGFPDITRPLNYCFQSLPYGTSLSETLRHVKNELDGRKLICLLLNDADKISRGWLGMHS